MTIDLERYCQFLVCPACHSKLAVDQQHLVCRSGDCRLRFEIRDDIPVMLADEAHPLSQEEWASSMQRVAPA